MKKMNNKGFSLVELIIVIAIMAILSAALAPQLMKYIEKSRVSTDKSTCGSIKSCINTTLTDEDANTAVVNKATNNKFSFKIKDGAYADVPADANDFFDELSATLGTLPSTKSSGSTYFDIVITLENSAVKSIDVDTDGKVMSK